MVIICSYELCVVSLSFKFTTKTGSERLTSAPLKKQLLLNYYIVTGIQCFKTGFPLAFELSLMHEVTLIGFFNWRLTIPKRRIVLLVINDSIC